MTEEKRKKLEKKALKRKKKRIKIACVACIVLAVIAVAVAVGVILHKKSESDNKKVINNSPSIWSEVKLDDGDDVFSQSKYTIEKDEILNCDFESAIKEIKNRDEAEGSYRVVKHIYGSDDIFELNYWTESSTGKGIYEYIFNGNDMGTGLDGVYYRTVIDGAGTIIDYQTKEYHTGDDFFERYSQSLGEITLDNLLKDVFDEIYYIAGEKANGDFIIKGDDVSIYVSSDEHHDTYILDSRGEVAIGYYISYGNAYDMPF